ncbi:MAG: FAD-dependent oxidoreductase [Candidatus Eremiobacteraeota bacterium]|nr:FAD-dependent oxidoreductase [Candidatus Eremiobacteraeota bacterium]
MTNKYDVIIVGASFGGVAAALSIASFDSVRVLLLEESDWIGGQATVQGVTRWDEADSMPVESSGSNRSYRDLRNAIRDWYATHATLSADGYKQRFFNPGFAKAGPPFSLGANPFRCDPNVATEILQQKLQQHSRFITVRHGVRIETAEVVDGVVRFLRSAEGEEFHASFYLDATDLGDLLQVCEVPWRIGAESQGDTGERSAPAQRHSEHIQPITIPIAVELTGSEEEHPIPKPLNYDTIAANQQFSVEDGDISTVFTEPAPGADTLWNYRQYLDPANFSDKNHALSRTTINYGSNDYQAAAIPTGSLEGDRRVIEEAREVSIACLYWLQNFCPRDDREGTGYLNIKLLAGALGRDDGTAAQPYIRESRRLARPAEVVVQSDIEAPSNIDEMARGAYLFADSCGIGWYGIDVHSASRGKPCIGTPWLGFGTYPFQIPTGALYSMTHANFVAACKNIGTTHVTSGAYRVHPVEWAIGEAAGALAAFCVTNGYAPAQVRGDRAVLISYQQALLERGVPLFWWKDVSFDSDAETFVAVQLLSVHGLIDPGDTLCFRPSDGFTDADKAFVVQRLRHAVPWPTGFQSRGSAAVWLCKHLDWLK